MPKFDPSGTKTLIDPRLLQTYLAVCEEGTISGAARRLNISQPSVTNAIARLEQVIGCSLFERTRTGIILSSEGELLRRRAQALKNLLDDTQDELDLSKDGIAGPLRVGGTPGALVSLLPQAILQMEQQWPDFAMHIVEKSDQDLDSALRYGEIEIAFVTVGIQLPPDDIEEILLSRDPFALIVGRENDHLPDELALQDMAGMRWVLPEAQGAFHSQIDALFINADIPPPKEAIYCDSLLTTKAIVRSGKRVTILPKAVAAAELSIGVMRAITIKDTNFQRSVGIRRLKNVEPSRLARALMDCLDIYHIV
jgi:LysR family transcriptional regulator, regulator of abg operon